MTKAKLLLFVLLTMLAAADDRARAVQWKGEPGVGKMAPAQRRGDHPGDAGHGHLLLLCHSRSIEQRERFKPTEQYVVGRSTDSGG